MAEPTTTTAAAGLSLTALAVGLFGPQVGPYALIAFAALSGAMWPLSAAETGTRAAGAWLLLRCALTGIMLTGLLASLAERWLDLRPNESLAFVAFFVGALGNGWQPVISAVGAALSAFAGRAGGAQK